MCVCGRERERKRQGERKSERERERRREGGRESERQREKEREQEQESEKDIEKRRAVTPMARRSRCMDPQGVAPRETLRGGIPGAVLEPLVRSWSHFGAFIAKS